MTTRAIKLAVIHDMPEEGLVEHGPDGGTRHHTGAAPVEAHRDDADQAPSRSRRVADADRVRGDRRFWPTGSSTGWCSIRGVFAARSPADTACITWSITATPTSAHELPGASTIVTCHDIDAFRCVAQPEEERRSRPFRAMTQRILSGLQRAACVVCGSEATRDDLVRHGLVPEERLRVVLNGIDPDFLPEPSALAREWAASHLARGEGAIDLLHVGNDVPRKRIDRLLQIVAAVREGGASVRLVRVGSPLTTAHTRLAQQLNVKVLELPVHRSRRRCAPSTSAAPCC